MLFDYVFTLFQVVFSQMTQVGEGLVLTSQCMQRLCDVVRNVINLHFDLEARVRKIEAHLNPDQPPCK